MPSTPCCHLPTEIHTPTLACTSIQIIMNRVTFVLHVTPARCYVHCKITLILECGFFQWDASLLSRLWLLVLSMTHGRVKVWFVHITCTLVCSVPSTERRCCDRRIPFPPFSHTVAIRLHSR